MFFNLRIGRKKSIYIYIVMNAVMNCLLALFISLKSIETNTQQILFALLRFLTGFISVLYSMTFSLGLKSTSIKK